MTSLDSLLLHFAACSPDQFLADLPIFADWLEETGHPLAERVRTAAQPEWPAWTCCEVELGQPRRYILVAYRETYPDDALHHVAVAERQPDGSFRWEIEADAGADLTLEPGWERSSGRRRSGIEPCLRDVDETVRALLADIDVRFGVVMLREARAAM